MKAFLAQFPLSEQPKHFGLILAIAAGICLAAICVGLALSPIPALPTDEFMGGARIAVTLPAGATLDHAVDIIEPLFPEEARSLKDFSGRYPELATALTATHGGILTMYGPHASGTAQFVLNLAGARRDVLLPSLGRAFPQEITYRLPDGRIARELVADPEAAEAQLHRVPGTDWLLFNSATSSLPLAFREENGNLEITTFPVEWLIQISARFPAGRSFCLNGVPATVPVGIESRWKTVHIPVPGFSTPLLAPRPRSPVLIEGTTEDYRNFCGIIG